MLRQALLLRRQNNHGPRCSRTDKIRVGRCRGPVGSLSAWFVAKPTFLRSIFKMLSFFLFLKAATEQFQHNSLSMINVLLPWNDQRTWKLPRSRFVQHSYILTSIKCIYVGSTDRSRAVVIQSAAWWIRSNKHLY